MKLRLLAAAALVAAAAVPGVAAAAPGPAGYPQYWFDDWKVPQLWAEGARGQGIVIAEIDTGVNADISALRGKVLKGKDFGSLGGDGRTDRDLDEFGHGTAMASLMVGDRSTSDITGMAPAAKILPIAVPLSGTSDASADDHLASAIRWAVDHKAKIISMSLGGARTPDSDSRSCRTDEQAAVNYALRKGVVLIASGGNRGTSDNAVESPAVCLGVVAVGAVTRSGKVADFSSRHPYLAFAAPGEDVASLSRVEGVGYHGNGTSQATAIATGGLALVWSKHPQLTGRQVVARVLATLDDKQPKRSKQVGFGLFDAYTATTADVPVDAPNPIYAAADPFLSRESAEDKATAAITPPAAVKPKPGPPGTVEIGDASPLLVGRVVLGLCMAGAGALALVGLTWLGVRRRRRRPVEEPVRQPLPPQVDEKGVVWHEVHVADDTSALRVAEPADDSGQGEGVSGSGWRG
jgi:subtilisin family serine protease